MTFRATAFLIFIGSETMGRYSSMNAACTQESHHFLQLVAFFLFIGQISMFLELNHPRQFLQTRKTSLTQGMPVSI